MNAGMATLPGNLVLDRADAVAAGPVLLQFAYLQGLDILTTLAFLLAGVQEGNVLVKAVLQLTGNPVLGLLAVKAAALLLGGYCWWRGRMTILKRANVFFAGLVAWNLFCLILGLERRF
jgi:hypothetical protein